MRRDLTMEAPDQYPDGKLPPNVVLGHHTLVRGALAFKRFHALRDPALVIGAFCTMDGVMFALGSQARMSIGDYCHFTNAVLLCEAEITIGSHVFIGWNATITDADFHPLPPGERIEDAIALSPLANGRQRPAFATAPIVIEDDAWVGPMSAILKGVRIGAGAFIEPGSVVTQNVPSRSRVMGNPAQVIGEA